MQIRGLPPGNTKVRGFPHRIARIRGFLRGNAGVRGFPDKIARIRGFLRGKTDFWGFPGGNTELWVVVLGPAGFVRTG